MPPDVINSPQGPRTRRELRQYARDLTRAATAAASAEKSAMASHYRVVRRQSYALQRAWLLDPDVQRVMGHAFVAEALARLARIKRGISEVVPSGAWLDAVWRRGEQFPPQDGFDAAAAADLLTAWRASGRISERLLTRCRVLLAAGVDPTQIIARWAGRSRMRLAHCRVRFGEPAYVDGRPMTGQYTRRPTPVASIGYGDGADDRYDRLSPFAALFCPDPPSVTAMQFRKIELLRGRDQRESERDAKARRKAEKAKLKQIKSRYGIEDDDADDEPETVDDEVIDVDCTDVESNLCA